MKMLYIIKVGTTFPEIKKLHGDFDDWVRAGLALQQVQVLVIDAQNGDPLPDPEACAGVVLTGSHDMVTDQLPWSEVVAAWIPSVLAAGVPFLGICYGHQLLAQAMGGRVGYHPDGPEAGTVEIFLLPSSTNDPLFAYLPRQMPVHAVHAQSVLSLPPGAVRLALNSFEPNHAFRLGKSAWGVQFHPEYDASIMQAYLLAEADKLAAKHLDVDELLGAVRETDKAAELLKRFGKLVEQAQPAWHHSPKSPSTDIG